MASRQVVRHWVLVPAFGGSNPSSPAKRQILNPLILTRVVSAAIGESSTCSKDKWYTASRMQTRPLHERLTLWIYIPLWLFFVYLYTQILSFDQGNISNFFLAGLYFILFGIHEAAHVAFMFLPPIVTAAAGSLSEIIFGGLITYAALRARAYFAAGFSMLWMMLAMNSAGNYMADARAQQMPLIGPSENPQHDWHFVFTQLGWLNHDTVIGGTIKIAGDLIGLIGLLLGLYLIIRSIIWRFG